MECENVKEKSKKIIQTNYYLVIHTILVLSIIILLGIVIGINSKKTRIEKQYHELQVKSEKTSQTLQKQIEQKDKKILELQQEEKKKEINEAIKSLESEKQKLEQEKQTLSTKIEELKKTSLTTQNNNSNNSSKVTRTTTETKQDTNSSIVYITNSGKKYHKANCSYLKKSKIEVTMSEAISRGYTPCSKCY